MKQKWKPLGTEKLMIEIDQEIYERRLVELAELFYDAFCELHLNPSVEPANNLDSSILEDQRKAG
jgi:hypothetical protein